MSINFFIFQYFPQLFIHFSGYHRYLLITFVLFEFNRTSETFCSIRLLKKFTINLWFHPFKLTKSRLLTVKSDVLERKEHPELSILPLWHFVATSSVIRNISINISESTHEESYTGCIFFRRWRMTYNFIRSKRFIICL